MAQIAVPVRPLPELQCTTTVFLLSAIEAGFQTRKTLSLTFNVFIALFCDCENEVEGWAMMVWPVVLRAAIAKVPSFIVSSSFRYIDYPVSVSMPLIQKISYLNSESIKRGQALPSQLGFCTSIQLQNLGNS
jgi:hypothetical protein